MTWNLKVGEILTRVRSEKPLVHHITNLVVTNITANATLAVGASPVMAQAREEVEEMVRLSRALVLNIGTLTPGLVEVMISAGQEANRRGVPVILDPVGVGVTRLRTESVARLLAAVRVSVVRGNASEIAIAGGFEAAIRGVDAVGQTDETAQTAGEVARRLGTVVAATGKIDYVSDGRRTVEVHNGHPLATSVTGTGCMATAVIAAFRAVEGDDLTAAAAALAYYGYAAEKAAAGAAGPGSFQAGLFDALFSLQPGELARGVRIVAQG
ncbi:MAG TPA: hydroxyethylthiazole kinase [Spirochaetia bacterium]|nr:hydroxyethylthiazole kinase [Spirochaetia bacterium]